MEYSKTDFLKDFAFRTQKNLEYIDNGKCHGRKVYEVTQLINSFLGLIVFPQQDARVRLQQGTSDEGSLIDDSYIESDLLNKLWSKITKNSYTNSRKNKSLDNLLYHLRNAISHGKIDFEVKNDDKHEIHSLTFKDRHPDNTQAFSITLKIDLIREFLDDFTSKLHLLENKHAFRV